MSTQTTPLTRAPARALEGIDILRSPVTGGADMATLRANGNRRDVIWRLCSLGLAYAAGNYSDPDGVFFNLTDQGSAKLAEVEATR